MFYMFRESEFNKDISSWNINIEDYTDDHFDNIEECIDDIFIHCPILEEYKPKNKSRNKSRNEECYLNKYTDEECCISYEKININNNYTICNTCNKQYLYENLLIWFNTQETYEKTCPHCRQFWTNKKVYINTK